MTPRRAVLIHPEAAREAREGWRWYLARSPETAVRFQAAIDDAIEHIRERPGSWPRFAGNTRRYLLRGFPYAVIYREQGDAIQILAFAHLRRRPNYWRGRE